MLGAGFHNFDLTKYLIQQVTQSPEERFETLVVYFPHAKFEDWELVQAGQRVQIIKKDNEEGGVLQFGTEVVTHDDGSIAALLGASPGASTSVSIMLELLETCFPQEMKGLWRNRVRKMIPSYGDSLSASAELCSSIRERSHKDLGLAL